MFCQLSIFVLSAVAGVLVCFKRDRIRRWGYIVGLASEPFWFWAAISADQWGVFWGSVVWTVIWIIGVYNHWETPRSLWYRLLEAFNVVG